MLSITWYILLQNPVICVFLVRLLNLRNIELLKKSLMWPPKNRLRFRFIIAIIAKQGSLFIIPATYDRLVLVARPGLSTIANAARLLIALVPNGVTMSFSPHVLPIERMVFMKRKRLAITLT